MATIQNAQSSKEYPIDNFLGLNTQSSLEMKVGEAEDCENFRITDDFNLQKRGGIALQTYTKPANFYQFSYVPTTIEFITAFKAKISSNNVEMLYEFVKEIKNGGIKDLVDYAFYEIDISTNEYKRRLGALPFSGDTGFTNVLNTYNIFNKDGYIYLMANNSNYDDELVLIDEINSYIKNNGTDTYLEPVTISGYIPTIYKGAKPNGADFSSKIFEGKNIIVPPYYIEYLADGTADYSIPQTFTFIAVTVNGVLTTAYTTNTYSITFTSVPASGAIVKILILPTTPLDNSIILKNTKNIRFGGTQNIDLHIWGNPDNNSRVYYSYNGDVSYFPENNYYVVGDGTYAITDMVAQYSRLIAFTEKEIYSAPFTLTDGIVSYPMTTLTTERGHTNDTARVQMIKNSPVFISGNEIWQIKGYTNNSDDRNIEKISGKVDKLLNKSNRNIFYTADVEQNNEYWVFYKNSMYEYDYYMYALIFNYKTGVWYNYKFYIADFIAEPLIVNGTLIFHSYYNKNYYKYSDTSLYDELGTEQTPDKRAITAYYQFPFLELGKGIRKKAVNKMYVVLQPNDNAPSYVNIEYWTNIILAKENQVFTLQKGENPLLRPRKMSLKNVQYFKMKIISDTISDTAEVMSINLSVFYGDNFK